MLWIRVIWVSISSFPTIREAEAFKIGLVYQIVPSGWFVSWVHSIHSVPGSRLCSPEPRQSHLLKAGWGETGKLTFIDGGPLVSPRGHPRDAHRWGNGGSRRCPRWRWNSSQVYLSPWLLRRKGLGRGSRSLVLTSAVHNNAGDKWRSHGRLFVFG